MATLEQEASAYEPRSEIFVPCLTLSFVALWLSVRIGVFFRERRQSAEENEREDFGTIITAILTLLGLIVGFSFSMAIYRYDQRKVWEKAEANAIGTE